MPPAPKDISDLLTKISSIHAEMVNCGQKFNIFNILRLSEREDAHSNILAALLDPGGEHAHGQKEVFLEKFLKRLGISTGQFNPHQASVEREVAIPSGRIDIALTDKDGKRIYIENKIHAAEQEDQLGRYYNYRPEGKQSAPPIIVFLTLDGRKPVNAAPKIIKIANCISYSKEIFEWLTECKKIESNPATLEIIKQYQFIIKQNVIMDNIIKAISSTPDTYQAFFYLLDKKDKLQDALYLQPFEALANKNDFEIDCFKKGVRRYKLTNPKLRKNNVGIFFDGINVNGDNCFLEYDFGICSFSKLIHPKEKEIYKSFRRRWPKEEGPQSASVDGVRYIIWKGDKTNISSVVDGSFSRGKLKNTLQDLIKIIEKALASDTKKVR